MDFIPANGVCMAYKDKANGIEYITLKVPRISFTDVKPYLTDEVVPAAIKAYAEKRTDEGKKHEKANVSVLYSICALSQETINNSLKLLNEAISSYKSKHGYSDSCESMENTVRLWENAKIKMLEEKYFEEVMADSIKNIKSGKSKISTSGLKPKEKAALKITIDEINFELNHSHFLPKTDPLGRLLRGESK